MTGKIEIETRGGGGGGQRAKMQTLLLHKLIDVCDRQTDRQTDRHTEREREN